MGERGKRSSSGEFEFMLHQNWSVVLIARWQKDTSSPNLRDILAAIWSINKSQESWCNEYSMCFSHFTVPREGTIHSILLICSAPLAICLFDVFSLSKNVSLALHVLEIVKRHHICGFPRSTRPRRGT